jgi:hypothetical protein
LDDPDGLTGIEAVTLRLAEGGDAIVDASHHEHLATPAFDRSHVVLPFVGAALRPLRVEGREAGAASGAERQWLRWELLEGGQWDRVRPKDEIRPIDPSRGRRLRFVFQATLGCGAVVILRSRCSRRSFGAIAFLVAVVLEPSLARAGAFEVQGLGPAGVAEVGARSARSEDGTAAFFNPGGLALGEGTRLELSPALSVSALRAGGEGVPVEDPFGVTLAASGTVPLQGPLGGRIRVGFSGYFLPAGALRLLLREGDRPFFPYYDNRTQRLVVLPALGVRILRGLGMGVGVNVLAGVDGPARIEPGATGAPEPRIDIDARTVLAVNAGLRFDPAEHVRLALVYRQRFAIPMRIGTVAEVGGVPLTADIETRHAMFDPETFIVASSFDLGRASFEADVLWQRWSEYEGPFLAVKSTLPGVNLASRPVGDMWRDVISLRLAASVRLDVGARSEVVLRMGVGGEPTVMKSVRQGRTNLVDGNKASVGLGATLVLRELLPKTLRMGLGVGGQFVGLYAQEKVACRAQPCPAWTVVGPDGSDPGANIDNPGYPRLEGSGSLWTASFGLGVDL